MAEDKQATGTVATTDTPAVVDALKTETAKTTIAADDIGETETAPEGGADGEKEPAKGPWAENWRELMGGKDGVKQLARYADPTGVWKKVKNLEKALSERAAGPVKPGKDASPEDISAYREQIGLPKSVETYAEKIKFGDGVVIGETDKPIIDQFTKMAFERHHSPEAVADFVAKYYELQRQTADQQTETDDRFAQESRDTLRDEWGPQDYKRNVNASGSLFREMPKEVADAILTARTSDGRLIGNMPDFIKWAAQTALELNPAASVFPSGGAQPGKGPQDRLNEIRELRKTKPNEYNAKAKAFEAEEIELNDVLIRMQKRGKAA